MRNIFSGSLGTRNKEHEFWAKTSSLGKTSLMGSQDPTFCGLCAKKLMANSKFEMSFKNSIINRPVQMEYCASGERYEYARGRNFAVCGRICGSFRKLKGSVEEMFQMINNVECHS